MAKDNNVLLVVAAVVAVGIVYFKTQPKQMYPPVPLAPANNPLTTLLPYQQPGIANIISNLGGNLPAISPINNPKPLDLDIEPAGNAQYFTI